MRRRIAAAALAASTLALALTGCTGGPAAAPPSASSSSSSSVARTPTALPAEAGLDHVVVLVLENKPSSRIIGSDEAPYLNGLAAEWALATNYTAIRHPSLPNYLAMTSGTTGGVTRTCDPDACGVSVRTIVHEVEDSGRTWRMYAESMPAPCTMHNAGRYAVRHNPFLYDRDVTADEEGCAEHDVPYDRLAADLEAGTLPNLAFISPDLCHDMHDCSIATGDAWLSREVPKLLGSDAFRSSRSLLVVTFDEGIGEDNRIVTVFAGPAARAGARSARPYTHYSLLRTIEDAWGLAPLAEGDRAASPMSDLLRRSGG